MRRRNLLLGTIGLMSWSGRAAALPVPPGGRIGFDIERKGSLIGTHDLTFSQDGRALTINIAIRIAVYFGPIRLFHYAMDGIEQWADGQVFHVQTRTDNNGRQDYMQADRSPAGLFVEGTKAARYLAPPNALPATHWNQAELDGPWINPQDGRLFHPHVAALGDDAVPTEGPAERPARHYRLSGDVSLDLWYGPAQDWASR